MNIAKACLSLSLLLSLGACAGNPVIKKDTRLARNSEKLIGEFGYWKPDCSKQHFDIFIEQYPEGGDLRFEVGTLVIPDEPIVGRAGKCVGQSVQSKRVVYIPDEDFVGLDFVSYVVKSSVFLGDKSYDVRIRVD